MIRIPNPFKKTLSSLMSNFIKLADDLRTLADQKAQEASTKEAQAKALMIQVESCEAEAEEALNAAERIEAQVGSSVILEAAAEKL